MSQRLSPYRAPFDRWSDAVKEAHRAMPTTADGFVVNPRFLPKASVQRDLTARWREWSRRFPSHLWPTWLEGWLAESTLKERTP